MKLSISISLAETKFNETIKDTPAKGTERLKKSCPKAKKAGRKSHRETPMKLSISISLAETKFNETIKDTPAKGTERLKKSCPKVKKLEESHTEKP